MIRRLAVNALAAALIPFRVVQRAFGWVCFVTHTNSMAREFGLSKKTEATLVKGWPRYSFHAWWASCR